MDLIRKKVEATTEKRIITGMIVDKRFMQEILHMIKLDYFQNSFTKTVAGWCIDFYNAYEEVPKSHIQDIFNKAQGTMKEDESKLISILLSSLSDQFEQENAINVDYYLDEATLFVKQRDMEIRLANAQELLLRGDIQGAEDLFLGFDKIARLTSDWVSPFEQTEIDELFREKAEIFFQFPGELGRYLGNVQREWLVGVSAPFKKGKTWFVDEMAVLGAMSQLKVVVMSLEMKRSQQNERIYKRLMAASGEGGIFIYPTFDCQLNQNGECDSNNRTGDVPLIDEEGEELPEYSPDMRYKPCHYCREHDPYRYQIATWYEEYDRPAFDIHTVSNSMKAWKKLIDPYIKVISFPKFSVNVSGLERSLDVLERTENYVPDIIIVDQVDVVMPEKESMQGVAKEDEAWMCLARMAGRRKALVVTPTQITKEGLEAEQLHAKHTARWVGKLGHVDAMWTLNQTREEKLRGVMRIGQMAHRHEEFDEDSSCTILQQLTLGQVNLDSQR